MRLSIGLVAALVLALLSAISQADDVRFTVTELDGLPDVGGSIGMDVNEAGDVAGYSLAEGSTPVLFSGGTVQTLGTSSGTAHAINDSGQIAGKAMTSGGETHAFLYSGGAMTDLGALPGSTWSTAYDINDAGDVVGHSEVGGNNRAFLYSNGTMHDLGIQNDGPASLAFGVNASAHVVGTSGGTAFLYSDGVMHDLGGNTAWDINDDDVVVGSTDQAIAAYYDGGTWHELGTLGGWASNALGINNNDQIVGYSLLPDDTPHAYLYENGTMTDLNSLIDPTSGWDLWKAHSINDRGQITGLGNKGAFLLTPIGDSNITPLPEPSTWGLMALGLVAFGLWRRKAR